MSLRDLGTGHPLEELRIGDFQKFLELVKLLFIHPADFLVGKASEHEIHLAHAAMPGAKKDSAPPRVETGARTCRSCHDEAFRFAADIVRNGGRVSLATAIAASNLQTMFWITDIPVFRLGTP